MKANKGHRIRLTKKISYETIYGLVRVEKGSELIVKSRNHSDNGVEVYEKAVVSLNLGKKKLPINVCDNEYEIINGDTSDMEREGKINLIDTLIHLQKDIIKNIKDFEYLTAYDFNTLNKSLKMLKELKLRI